MSKTFVLSTIIVLTVVMLVIYINQRKMIYYPQRMTVKPKQYSAGRMEVVYLNTSDGLILKAWYRASSNKKPTIVYLHGNAGHLGYRMPFINQFLDKDYGVLLFSYRGYADNPGKPTEQGLYRDGRAAMDFVMKKNIKPQCIVLYGESIGSGVATKLAEEYTTGALILQSPFTSMADIARYHYPWIPLKPWDKFDSVSRISRVNAPLLIIHGTKDHIVPIRYGKELFNAAREPKYFVALKSRGHNNLWGPKLYKAIIIFLENTLTTKCSD